MTGFPAINHADVEAVIQTVRLERLLGYAPLVEFGEGLRRTVEFFKTKGR